MLKHQMSPAAEEAISTKIRILSKYGIGTNQLDSIYDLIYARSNQSFVLQGMSHQDQADLIEAIHTIFTECNAEMIA